MCLKTNVNKISKPKKKPKQKINNNQKLNITKLDVKSLCRNQPYKSQLTSNFLFERKNKNDYCSKNKRQLLYANNRKVF